MREIRYRAWDKIFKRMVDWEEIGRNEPFRPAIEFKRIMFGENYNFILMQSTGIKDKNDIEIYEGDLVDIKEDDGEWCPPCWDNGKCPCSEEKHTTRAKVIFKGGAFTFKHYNSTNEMCQWKYRFRKDKCSKFEVVGNIYENSN